MLFLDNPRKATRKGKRRKAATKRATRARRRVRRAHRRTQQSEGKTMAKKRRRRATARRSAPRRRRRRASVRVVYRSRTRRVRRRRAVVARRSRRRYRRNPGGTGIVATIKQGAIDGALVLAGQAAQGRASSLVARVVPIGGIAGTAIADVGSAVAVTMLARKFLPGRARMISAGAFSNAVRRLVSAVSPSTAALLGDASDGLYSADLYGGQVIDGVAAYPELSMGAYPGGGLGDAADDPALGAYVVG